MDPRLMASLLVQTVDLAETVATNLRMAQALLPQMVLTRDDLLRMSHVFKRMKIEDVPPGVFFVDNHQVYQKVSGGATTKDHRGVNQQTYTVCHWAEGEEVLCPELSSLAKEEEAKRA